MSNLAVWRFKVCEWQVVGSNVWQDLATGQMSESPPYCTSGEASWMGETLGCSVRLWGTFCNSSKRSTLNWKKLSDEEIGSTYTLEFKLSTLSPPNMDTCRESTWTNTCNLCVKLCFLPVRKQFWPSSTISIDTTTGIPPWMQVIAVPRMPGTTGKEYQAYRPAPPCQIPVQNSIVWVLFSGDI